MLRPCYLLFYYFSRYSVNNQSIFNIYKENFLQAFLQTFCYCIFHAGLVVEPSPNRFPSARRRPRAGRYRHRRRHLLQDLERGSARPADPGQDP